MASFSVTRLTPLRILRYRIINPFQQNVPQTISAYYNIWHSSANSSLPIHS